MKKGLILILSMTLSYLGIAQVPNSFSYQMVIRNGNNELVANTTVGIRIGLLGGNAADTLWYEEEHKVKTNLNGLAYITIGKGNILRGTIATIDWTRGPFFIKSETDPTGGTNYSLIIVSQMLSVPYAIYAKTAEKLSTPVTESDPLFSKSIAKGITAEDTARWSKKEVYDGNSGGGGVTNESDPVFSNSVAKGIRSVDTAAWNNKLNLRDTMNLLRPYLRSADTASLSNRLNQKVDLNQLNTNTLSLDGKINIADTASMLANYRLGINTKVNIADTASMLLPYLRDADTTNMLANYRTGINAKVNIADTASMLLPYLRGADTTSMLLPYLRDADTTAMLANYQTGINSKVNILDTASMLQPYLRDVDTTSMLLPYLRDADTTVMLANYRTDINAKVNILDTASMLEPYLREPDGPVPGDILYYNINNKWARLPTGQDGQFLMLSSGMPTWTSTAPGSPTGVSASAGNGQATVSFTAPLNSGGSAITGYTVTSNPEGRTATGSSSPLTVTGLTNGISYTFTVVANNSVGNSVASAASSSVIPVTVPGAPTGVVATAGNTSASVAFVAPASDGGSAITIYTVTSNPEGRTATGSSSPLTLTGLTNGTVYTFTVLATTAVGNSVASAASSAVTPSTVPGAPTGVVATAGNTSASVAFVAPASDGGRAITLYTVTSNPGNFTATGASSPLTVTGLTNGISYTFTVVATNSVGNSVASAASSAVIPVPVPTVTTTAISSITVTGASSGGNITNDGGASVSVRGVVWSTSVGPTVALSTKTSDGTGVGSFTSTLASLTGSTTYYVRAYATNSAGTAYGNEVSFTTSAPFSCGTSSVSDIDGNSYTTVSIGTQCWMKENLKTSRYRNGGSIPNVTDNTTWINLTTGAWSNYENNTSNNAIYGKLYNWYTTLGDTLCPTGWGVPTDSEWDTLTTYLGGLSVAGGKMKSTGTTYWNTDPGSTNSSGFSALPGGYRDFRGSFNDIRVSAFFWSATEYANGYAWTRYLFSYLGSVYSVDYIESFGASVRCLRD